MRLRYSLPVFLALAFITAMLWAKARDPFKRVNFSLKTASGQTAKGIAVMPKPVAKHPTVIFLYGSGEDLSRSGNELRQLAELGLNAVGIEYDKTNQSSFDEQFIALNRYLNGQSWVQSNAVVWIGLSLGAQRSLSFALRHPEYQPQLLVRLSGGWVEELGEKTEGRRQKTDDGRQMSDFRPPASGLRCPFLLVHAESDEIFPVADARQLAELFKQNGTPVDLRIFPNQSHGFGTDRPVIIRGIAEYCANFFGSMQPFHNNTRPLHLSFWLPVSVFAVVILIRGDIQRRKSLKASDIPRYKWSKVLSCIAWVLTIAAILETTIHLGLPRLRVSETKLNVSRRWLVRAPLKNDFDWLAQKPIWRGQRIAALLQHLELANLQRKFFYSDLNEAIYRDFVLSPAIGDNDPGDLNWRRQLWESFYPRTRRETDPLSASHTVVRYLRERVTIVPDRMDYTGIKTIWEQELTDVSGFEKIYVAALRSVGIAARLNDRGQAELFAENKWQTAPRPIFFPFK